MLFEEIKRTVLQWSQDNSNSNGLNVKNVTCDSSRHFGEQGGNTCKEKFMNLISNAKTLETSTKASRCRSSCGLSRNSAAA